MLGRGRADRQNARECLLLGRRIDEEEGVWVYMSVHKALLLLFGDMVLLLGSKREMQDRVWLRLCTVYPEGGGGLLAQVAEPVPSSSCFASIPRSRKN